MAEMWVIKSDASGEFATTQISFTSNGQKFTSIGTYYTSTFIVLRYDNNEVAGYDLAGGGVVYEFDNEAYRKLTFDTPPTGALLTWLQSNAVKQPDDTAVQGTKAVTITSNGTVSVTPDAPYDALKKVDVTVNVSGGGGVETCALTTSVYKSPGSAHGTIYAYSGNTFITIASEGTYSINKNSIIFVMRSYEGDTYTGLDNLFFSFIDHVMVCNVTSDIATYNFVGDPIIEN